MYLFLQIGETPNHTLATSRIYFGKNKTNPLEESIVIFKFYFPSWIIRNNKVHSKGRITKKKYACPVELQFMASYEHEMLEVLCAEILREEHKFKVGAFDNISDIFSDRWDAMENSTPVSTVSTVDESRLKANLYKYRCEQ